MGLATMILLTGCQVDESGAVKSSLQKSKIFQNRAAEYAKGAPRAPYDPDESRVSLTGFDEDAFLLDGDHLAMIAGAANRLQVDPVVLATIIESELRNLDPGELDRDVVSALAGENTSIGIAQVLVSTAEEIEKEDPADLMPDYSTGDKARTERIRRLAADDWSILYAANYLKLLGLRFPGEQGLAPANRYTGRAPSATSADKQEILDQFAQIFR